MPVPPLTYDERHGPLKTQLDNTFLMGDQEYPSNVLMAKRLVTDFVPTTSAVNHKCKKRGSSDVALVETNSNFWPTCYCCKEQHPRGYRKCPTVTKTVRKRTIKAVKAGHFQQGRKQGDNSIISTKGTTSTDRKSTPKKGNAFVEVKENNEEKEEEDLVLPTYEEYLRENGVISLNIGDANHTFGRDCVFEFGIGCVQVADTTKPATTMGCGTC